MLEYSAAINFFRLSRSSLAAAFFASAALYFITTPEVPWAAPPPGMGTPRVPAHAAINEAVEANKLYDERAAGLGARRWTITFARRGEPGAGALSDAGRAVSSHRAPRSAVNRRA